MSRAPLAKGTKERSHSGRRIRLSWVAGLVVFGLGVAWPVLAAQKMADHAGYKDPAMFTRLPNYYLASPSSVVDKQFDSYEFWVTDRQKETKQRIEGHYVQYYYYYDQSAGAVPSPLQVIRNYQNAAARIGAQVLYESVKAGSRMRTTLRLVKDGRESWAEVDCGNGATYYLRIVERQEMQQQVIASAEALQSGLKQSGHVEVPGIFFDFGKADLKPESEPALQEVAKVLKASPSVRVWVVGHTDYVGSAEANVTLAQGRAAAVVRALVQGHAIDAKRLSPYGVGPYAPIASNAAEEGRARNRRVELVAQPEK